MQLRWVFDRLPPSGARRGGDPAEHAFEHDIKTFVREVVQNANDQSLPKAQAEVSFSFHEVAASTTGVFLEALSWTTLRLHLDAIAQTRRGRALQRTLKRLNEEGKLLVLRIEDRGTIGLVGDEMDGDSHFRALCKDTLYSHKANENAGGSYGLGKSVLWNFSSLSTVLFNSNLSKHDARQASPRLIGRAELPSHAIGNEWFSGSGWFGRFQDLGQGPRAESVWGEPAKSCANRLLLDRGPEPGTSIMILGFRDPSEDREETIPQQIEAMRRAAAHYFWPAISRSERPLRVAFGQDGQRSFLELDQFSELAPFLECAKVDAPRSDPTEPGHIGAREIELDLPARIDGGGRTTARALLVVRLADERSEGRFSSNVAIYRGSGMVTRYWDLHGLALGSQPFHAVLKAGLARSDTPDESDHALEAFLRAAEPPGHDAWKSTPGLKEAYRPGYKKALDHLLAEIRRCVAEMTVRKSLQGTSGPDLLRKRFPLGSKGSKGGTTSAFHFTRLEASFDGERWSFQGEVEPTSKGQGWEAAIRLFEMGEDGGKLAEVEIEAIELRTEGSEPVWREGSPVILAGSALPKVVFLGTSVPMDAARGSRAELGLEVTGRILSS